MKRTPLRERSLPDYLRSEEIFNMVSHIVGGALGVIALTLCVIFSALHKDAYAVVGSAVYGSALILLYTSSSVYHGLKPSLAKKVMQVIDHCTIYFLIAATYTPIVLCPIRRYSAAWGWGLFCGVWTIAAAACVFTAIDLKKYSKLSMACYIGLGWCIVIAAKVCIKTIAPMGLFWLLLGGISYTIGAVFYSLLKKIRFMHSVFHIFVVLGSLFQFFSIFFYII